MFSTIKTTAKFSFLRGLDLFTLPKIMHSVVFLVMLFCVAPKAVEPRTMCIEAERRALLSFKRDLRPIENQTDDPLSSWGSEYDKRDCCEWLNVRCGNESGRVVSLTFTSWDQPFFGNKISPSLFELRHLTVLNFDSINFTGSEIPSGIGMLSRLRELTISYGDLSGEIPAELGNLSRLESVNFAFNNLRGSIPETFQKLVSLKILDLRMNQLNGSIPGSLANLSRLETLALQSNFLQGSIPETFKKLTYLRDLDLGRNKLNGSIPDIFMNMSDLDGVYLEHNMLEGELPRSIWNLSSLKYLSLTSNELQGQIPKVMSQLALLVQFDISRNFFQGEITESYFTNISMLKTLDMSSNSLSLNFHPNWIPPFILESILLGSCKLGPRFPKWLRSQTNYSYLNISNSGISDSLPTWFWYISSIVELIDLSDNQISGEIKNDISLGLPNFIDLSSNQLEGPIPSFFSQVLYVSLFQNKFSKLSFSCHIKNEIRLEFLDVSYNELSGELLDCWSGFIGLEVLILSNNNLSGRVPSTFGSLDNILSLNLNKNKFTGELPSTLKNCRNLVVIDFGENNLSGAIPSWFGEVLFNLAILSLRFNNFTGDIPSSLCHLSKLIVLDFSSNNIAGKIPRCIDRLVGMRTDTLDTKNAIRLGFQGFEIQSDVFAIKVYEENLLLAWKGGIAEFKRTLALVRSIDLSSNQLSGEIPRKIIELSRLVSLNLSRNNLSGHIPGEIGRMESLDTLDLSRNRLTGRIPQGLAEIDRLSSLDLSNNNLSGKIPTGTQLQSFQSAYWGNAELCGDPLQEKCLNVTAPMPRAVHEDPDKLLSSGFYISIAIGFTTAIWGVCCVLIFHKPLRYAYFKLLSDVGEWLYLRTTIQNAKLRRIIKG